MYSSPPRYGFNIEILISFPIWAIKLKRDTEYVWRDEVRKRKRESERAAAKGSDLQTSVDSFIHTE